MCLNYDEEHRNLQPAKYFDRVARETFAKGHSVSVIGGTRRELRLFRINSSSQGDTSREEEEVALRPRLGRCTIKSLILDERPDAVVISVGPMGHFGRSASMSSDCAAIGVISYPMYSLREVLDAGLLALTEEFPQVCTHIMGAVLRRANINRIHKTFEKVIVESKRNRAILCQGRPRSAEVVHIPPGVDNEFLDASRGRAANKRQASRFIYIGSASPLRGTRDLVRAFREVRMLYREAELRMLLRPDKSSMKALRRLSREASRVAGVHLSTDPLSKNMLIENMLASSIAVFPFRLVQSDMPVGPLEASECGCRVIVSNLDGLPDFTRPTDRIIAKVSQENLVRAMTELLEEERRHSNITPQSVSGVLSWGAVTDELLKILQKEAVRRYELQQSRECS